MAKVLMIQGTMSNVGKSFLVAGLCRVFKQDGYKVAPFKSQNMALNSFVTKDGKEIGRAQAMQAEAAGVDADVSMNPILLKPTDDNRSEVILEGRSLRVMAAKDYFTYKKSLIPHIKKAFERLEEEYDIIVIEGAGSPAEINLKENDIVNMGIAKLFGAKVLLVGDIDRGGVFAQLLGTINLLEEDEKLFVSGLIINKFRGDKSLLDSGIEMIEEKTDLPVTGVVPYKNIRLEDEDSLSERLQPKRPKTSADKTIDIAVIRFPRISNFTDFDVFEQFDNVSVRFVDSWYELKEADMIVLPGSKNTVEDLRWMKDNGMQTELLMAGSYGIPIFGICGGYQMLGCMISDDNSSEKEHGLLKMSVDTVIKEEKLTRRYEGKFGEIEGIFSGLSGKEIIGYEVHMGETTPFDEKRVKAFTSDGTGYYEGNVYGTYIHGIFDRAEVAKEVVSALAKRKGIELKDTKIVDYRKLKEQRYDELADLIRESLDMDKIYEMMDIER